MTDTVGAPEPDPDLDAEFAKLLRDMAAGRPARVHEPSARARMLQNEWLQEPPPTPWRGEAPAFGDATAEAGGGRKARYRRGYPGARVWPRNVAIGAIVCALAFAIVETDRARPKSTSANARQATPAASATSSDPAHFAADEVIPLAQLFPKTVPGANGVTYTLLQSGKLADCIKSDLVGAKLAGLFAQSDGCVGGEEALYKDDADDEFNVIVFTLKDAGDALRIMNDLSMDDTDFEVATQVPPAGSGVADLSAEEVAVQDFAGHGNRLGVFMAQWADGHTTDPEDLGGLLAPLQNSIGKTLLADGLGR